MKFIFAALALVQVVLSTPVVERQAIEPVPVPTDGPTPCLLIIYRCFHLVDTCVHESADWVTNPWSKKSCVAAATCTGVGNLVSYTRCAGYPVPDAATLPNLDYNVYAGVVGDCAWASGGCPITPQNYIDFIYNTFTSGWPESGQWVVDNWWNPITQWAATGPSIPYTNFNDWLHYSS